MKGKQIVFICGILALFSLLCFYSSTAYAEKNHAVSGKNYILPDNSDYMLSDGSPTETFFYGAKSMGTLQITGALEKKTTYNGFTAYGVNGTVSIHYAYDGRYQCVDVDRWYVDDDGTGKVNSYGLGFMLGVGHGCIIIEKSSDGKMWEKTKDPILNYFTGKKSVSESLVYSIPESEIKNGCYYRVLVAYRFSRRTGDGFWWIGDRHEYKKCIELYSFYVCSEKNYITVRDIGNGSNLIDQASTEAGFMVCKNGSQATVTVNGSKKECKDYDFFVEPGEYRISITTRLGSGYKYNITVTNGSDFTPLTQKIYVSDKDKGFLLSKKVSYVAFGSQLTSLFLATPKGTEIKQNDSKYGIKGKSISLYLKLNQEPKSLGAGWVISDDTWGSRKNEQVCGVDTGTVGKGALIIQTSSDGKNWRNIDKGRYEKGLYTTDYASYYGKDENVLIYTPSGQDVINGVYIRVLFAYQLNHVINKQYRDYVEVYEFYLCSDDLGAITFHNLSVANTLAETYADMDQNTVEVYKQAETLEDGSYTVTGFQIDKKLNPTVRYTIRRDGAAVNGTQNKYDKSGKYDITLISAVGSTRELTIYVDRKTPEEAMQQYFGEGFIIGKRIFSEGEYPVYESGKFSYHVSELDRNVLPLYGQITNLFTGSVITVEKSAEEKTGIISEPGEYQAVFATDEKAFTGELTGDARVFTFRFRAIAQGTAPGPRVNRKLLDEYSHSGVVDCNPVYYGLTYSSAGKGNITLAFGTKEEAVEYAYNYEKGTVEKQENGEYRYTGSFLVGQKTKFDSTWNLTDAVNYFAEAAVQKQYFDMTDEFTYLSMKAELLEKHPNLRQMELERSIIVFAEDQKEELTDLDALPLLNDKPYAYLDLETGEVERGFSSFEFLSDQYGGIDSKSVTITDSEGGRHSIRYAESVGQQLLADNCPSGIVTVREETMYGDFAEYPAVYIAPGDNTTALTLTCKQGEESKTGVYSSLNDGLEIIADSFAITGLNDPLDPYALVIIKHKQYEAAYTAKDVPGIVWTDPGKYSITCINRMGYGYMVLLTIEGTEGATIDETTTMNPLDPDYAMPYQSWQLPSVNTNDGLGTITAKPQEQKNRDNTILIVVGVLAGLGIIVGVILFIYRRNRLFSRMSDIMKREEKEKHE